MFRSLLWKEWRQLRTLRWSGVAIGILTPMMLLTLTEAANRGWLLGSTSETPASTVVQDLMPMVLAAALWPLLTLMILAQAGAGDRATGTEAFLLQRPVPRRKIWLARLVASLGNVLIVVASHSVVWWLAVLLLGEPQAFDRGEALTRLFGGGAVGCLIAFMAGAASVVYARSPLQAVMIGLLLTAIPVVVGLTLSGALFLGYRFQGARIGLAVPLLALVGYAVSSYLAECRGEPAGRGRMRRGLIAVGVGLVAMPLFVAASAPIVMRWDAKLGLGNTQVLPAPSGTTALVLNSWQRAGWLVDTRAGKPLLFLPPPVADAAWDATGERVALLHAAAGSGRMGRGRLTILDRAGGRLRDDIPCGECRMWWGTGLKWSADSLVVQARVPGGEGLLFVDTATGRKRTLRVPGPEVSWMLVEARQGGQLYVLRLLRGDPEQGLPPAGALHELDVAGASLGPEVRIPDVGNRYYAASALSPSGALWLRRAEVKGEQARVFDLSSGESVELPAKNAEWLADDRLAWVEKRQNQTRVLMVGRPEAARPVHTLSSPWALLSPSPNRRKLLVTLRVPGEASRFRRALYDSETDAWQELSVPADSSSPSAMQWAGPDRLALVEQGALSLLEPGAGSSVIPVIGRAR